MQSHQLSVHTQKTSNMACLNKCTRQDCLLDYPLRRIPIQDPTSDDGEPVDYKAIRRQRHNIMDMADYDDEVEEGEHLTSAKRPGIPKYDTTHSNTTNNNVLTVTNHARQRPRNRLRVTRRTIKDLITLLESVLGSNITNHGVNVLHDCTLSKEDYLALSYSCSFVPLPRKRLIENLLAGFARFERNVRLRKYFASSQCDPISTKTETILHQKIGATLTIEEANDVFTPTPAKKAQ